VRRAIYPQNLNRFFFFNARILMCPGSKGVRFAPSNFKVRFVNSLPAEFIGKTLKIFVKNVRLILSEQIV